MIEVMGKIRSLMGKWWGAEDELNDRRQKESGRKYRSTGCESHTHRTPFMAVFRYENEREYLTST